MNKQLPVHRSPSPSTSSIPVKKLAFALCTIFLYYGFTSTSTKIATLSKFVIPPKGRQLDDCGRVTGSFSWSEDGEFWPSPSFGFAKAHLSQRMDAWTHGPIANQTVWTEFNRETCTDSRVGRNVDQASREGAKSLWRSVNETTLATLRLEVMVVLASAYDVESFIPPRGGWVGSKGIVYTATRVDSYSRIITSLKLLRAYGTVLDAEVFYGDESQNQPSAAQIEILRRLGAIVRVLNSNSHDIKSAAIVQARFEQVLFLDDSVLPVKNVTSLFDSPGYRSLGVMLWSDVWKDTADNPMWSIIGLQCRDEWAVTSSVMLIDKSKHLDVLLVTAHMAENSRFWFGFGHGEGNLLRFSLLGLRKRWAVAGRHLEAVGFTSNDGADHGEFCGTSMMLYDAFGKPAFLQQSLSESDSSPTESIGLTQQLVLSPIAAFAPALELSSTSMSSFKKALSAKHDGNTTADGQASANFQGLGAGLLVTPLEARERALLERGLFTRIHESTRAGKTINCLDFRWHDWRTEAEKLEEKVEKDLAIIALGFGPCAVPILEVDYRMDHLMVVEWKEDSLRNFERNLREIEKEEGDY